MNVNKVNVFHEDTLIKSNEVRFEIFDSKLLFVEKTVDRPDDYYFPNDIIIFTIKLRNDGSKILRNIRINDTIDDIIENNYDIISTHGEYIITNNVVEVINITLSPNEEALITFKKSQLKKARIITEEEYNEEENE